MENNIDYRITRIGGQPVRYIYENGTFKFSAVDLGKAAGIANPLMSVQRKVSPENVYDTKFKGEDGTKRMKAVDAYGAFDLILSNKDFKGFRKWIIDKVLLGHQSLNNFDPLEILREGLSNEKADI